MNYQQGRERMEMFRVRTIVMGVALLAVLVGACGSFQSVTVAQGQEAVLVLQPYFIGHGGVHPIPVAPGRTYVARSTGNVVVNMQPERYVTDFRDVMSKDGVPLEFHVAAVLQVTDSVRLVKDFGAKWFDNNVQSPLALAIRQSVRKHGMNETAISTTAIDEIDREVRAAVAAHLEAIKIPVALRDLSVGKANPPDAIRDQRLKTAEQEQRVNTEKQTKLAEDARLEAERARASADNAYRVAMQLSPDQYLALEQIKMLRDTCKATNCTFMFGASGLPTPMFQVK